MSIYVNFKVEERDLAPDLYELVGYFVLYITYGFMLYFLGTSFWEYKSTGGMKGHTGNKIAAESTRAWRRKAIAEGADPDQV